MDVQEWFEAGGMALKSLKAPLPRQTLSSKSLHSSYSPLALPNQPSFPLPFDDEGGLHGRSPACASCGSPDHETFACTGSQIVWDNSDATLSNLESPPPVPLHSISSSWPMEPLSLPVTPPRDFNDVNMPALPPGFEEPHSGRQLRPNPPKRSKEFNAPPLPVLKSSKRRITLTAKMAAKTRPPETKKRSTRNTTQPNYSSSNVTILLSPSSARKCSHCSQPGHSKKHCPLVATKAITSAPPALPSLLDQLMCSSCGERKHPGDCPKEEVPAPVVPVKRARKRCSVCKGVGHNKQTCPEKKKRERQDSKQSARAKNKKKKDLSSSRGYKANPPQPEKFTTKGRKLTAVIKPDDGSSVKKCGNCRTVGHNIKTCPDLKGTKNANSTRKRKRAPTKTSRRNREAPRPAVKTPKVETLIQTQPPALPLPAAVAAPVGLVHPPKASGVVEDNSASLEATAGTEDGSSGGEKTVHCTFCNIFLPQAPGEHALEKHMHSPEHLEVLASCFCVICKKQLKTEAAFESHVKTRKHKGKAERIVRQHQHQ